MRDVGTLRTRPNAPSICYTPLRALHVCYGHNGRARRHAVHARPPRRAVAVTICSRLHGVVYHIMSMGRANTRGRPQKGRSAVCWQIVSFRRHKLMRQFVRPAGHLARGYDIPFLPRQIGRCANASALTVKSLSHFKEPYQALSRPTPV